MVINDCFAMVCVAPFPRLPTWAAARFLEFAGQTVLGPTGEAPEALYSWLAMETAQARPKRAETGLIGRSPTALVDTFPIHTHGRGRGGLIGLGSGGCMGEGGGENFGKASCVRAEIEKR